MERWLPALASRFRVIVPDLPGCNGVPPLSSRHTADAYARWALELADALAIDRLHVAGLCSGTAVALALVGAAGARVDGVLLHTPFIRPALIQPAIRAQLALLASPAGALFGPLRRSELLGTLHRRVFANAGDVAAEQLAHDHADMVLADARAGRELAADLLAVDRTETLRSWRGPLGILLADRDAFVDAAATSALIRELAPQAIIETIPGGHGWTPAFVRSQHDALVRLASAGAA